MRLVSGYYEDYYPFNLLSCFNSFYSTKNPDTLVTGDVLIIWGGSDIHPSLYNKKKSSMTWAGKQPSERDEVEWALMQRARELGLPIIGVCRGAQMLCALAGGHLIQHVNGHSGTHMVTTYKGTQIQTNSIHHQMMVPTGTDHTVIAEIPKERLLSDVYYDEDQKVDHQQEPEFIYFNAVKGFAIQWHPEMMQPHAEANQFVLKEIGERLGA